MNAFRRVRDLFTFTKNEQKIFFFLALVFALGAGIKAYRLMTEKPGETRFDYRMEDSVFQARSALTADEVAGARERTTSANGAKSNPKRKIDLNTASKRELMQLPGVGDSTAARILRYRAAHGGRFTTEAELRRVKGIGPKKFEKLHTLVTVGKDSAASRAKR